MNSANFSRPSWRSVAVIAGLLTPVSGQAAPFCIGSEQVPPQCIYYDADSCRKEAIRSGGICSANPEQVRAGAQFAKYCVMTSQQVSLCNYMDRTSCDAAALHYHGACVSAPESSAAPGAPDPYRSN